MNEMEHNELQADLEREHIREVANEVNDGQLDVWVVDNKHALRIEFVEDNQDQFDEYCKDKYKEVNE